MNFTKLKKSAEIKRTKAQVISLASEIKVGGNFVDIISWDNLGHAHVDYKRFHDVE